MKIFEVVGIILLLSILVILMIESSTRLFRTNMSTNSLLKSLKPIQLNVTPNHIEPKAPLNGQVPMNIFQTWQDKNLPYKMTECVNSITECNPDFHHYLYDDQECFDFIKHNFDSDVLYAYQALIPGAYKADLWRCCILYKYGGIYLDIKFKCVNGFHMKELLDDEYFVKDLYETSNRKAVYNAFIIARPGNPILGNTIKQIVENVRNRYYGSCPLDVTGPTMLIKQFTPSDEKKLERLELIKYNQQFFISYRSRPILMMYPEYRVEQMLFSKKNYYADLWKQRSIYE